MVVVRDLSMPWFDYVYLDNFRSFTFLLTDLTSSILFMPIKVSRQCRRNSMANGVIESPGLVMSELYFTLIVSFTSLLILSGLNRNLDDGANQ